MDHIRPIGSDRDVDPVVRVKRAQEERERREREQEARERREPKPQAAPDEPPAPAEGPFEGDDGHMHVDVRA